MTEVKQGWTPEPWTVDGRMVYALQPAGWRNGVEQFDNRFSLGVAIGRQCSVEEAEANAHLIAASPELYEALMAYRRAIDQLHEDGYISDDIPGWYFEREREADAVLKKARGE